MFEYSAFNPRPLTGLDSIDMAYIHQLCFSDAWTMELFFDYFHNPIWNGVFGFGIEQAHSIVEHESLEQESPTQPLTTQTTPTPLAGFILGRTVYNANDILTFAVNPAYQGKGIGRALLKTYLDVVSQDCLLEVATGNISAIRLYNTFGFEIIASRREYYDNPDPAMRDAYVMGRKGHLSNPKL